VGGVDGERLRRQERARAEYKCNVQIKQIAEIPVYQALASGQVDAVLEDGSTSPSTSSTSRS